MKNKRAKITEQIIEAANNRFCYYGYSKSTMAEIATDCSMSAANLYRYFRDKSAIGQAIAKRYFGEEARLLKLAAESTDLSAAKRVTEFVLTSIRYNFKEFKDAPKIMELVEHICTDGTELIESHRKVSIGLLIAILKDGVKSKEFEIEDLEKSATAIHVATLVFHATPLFLMFKEHCKTETEMEEMARSVTELIVQGISISGKVKR